MEFRRVIGHDRAKRLLASTLSSRMPHALLLSGPEGIGKRMLAVELAKRLLCERGEGCGSCRSCTRVEENNHPDFHFFHTDTSYGIDQLREVRREAQRFPYEGEKRIFVMDDAEMMTREASNAFLKTLEEPPAFNLFLLVTSSENELPITIRSRCSRIGFSPLTRANVLAYLEGSDIETGRRDVVARLAAGSISCANFWADQANLEMRAKLAATIVGSVRNHAEITALSERMVRSGRDTIFYLYFLLTLFRDLWLVGNGTDPADIINADLTRLFEGHAWDRRWISTSLLKIQESLRIMRYNINRWLGVESLLIDIVR